MLLLVNHFIAAAFYLIGRLGEPSHNWLDVLRLHYGNGGCRAAHLQVHLSRSACLHFVDGYKAYKMQKFDADLFFRYRALAIALA